MSDPTGRREKGKREPIGALTLDHVDLKDRSNLAVFAKIYVRDAMGVVWVFEASSFRFDLKESCDDESAEEST